MKKQVFWLRGYPTSLPYHDFSQWHLLTFVLVTAALPHRINTPVSLFSPDRNQRHFFTHTPLFVVLSKRTIPLIVTQNQFVKEFESIYSLAHNYE